MMHSLIKYSVMELQKSIKHEIQETLREHTEAWDRSSEELSEALIEQREMLQEQLLLLYALPLDPKVKEARRRPIFHRSRLNLKA